MAIRRRVCGIYKVTNKVNGKIYIGQSVDIYPRWKQHIRISYNKNSKEYNYAFHKAIRKYGKESFLFEIVEECEVDELDDKEIEYIKKYNSFVYFENSNGYNLSIGGRQGSRFRVKSEEERRKIANNRNYKARGEHPSSKPVIFDGVEYACSKDLCDKFGFSFARVRAMLSHGNNMAVEFYVMGLRYKDEPMSAYTKTSKYISDKRAVRVDDLTFNSAKECAEFLGVKAGTLRSWLTNVRPTPKEYKDRGLEYIYGNNKIDE